MNETIRVVILESGTECREVNPLGMKPDYEEYAHLSDYIRDDKWNDAVTLYEDAEASLRSFEIEGIENGRVKINAHSAYGFKMELTPDTIHNAEILENGKCRIID